MWLQLLPPSLLAYAEGPKLSDLCLQALGLLTCVAVASRFLLCFYTGYLSTTIAQSRASPWSVRRGGIV